MPRGFQAPTLTELHTGLCDMLIYCPRDKIDLFTNVDVQVHNVVAQADSMKWEFDLKNLWLTPGRWSMMVKQYLDPEDFETWLRKSISGVGPKGRGINVLRTRVVRPRGGAHVGNRETRRWGSCMLALSYKALPAPQITLYSRTSYLGYIAALDLSVAWMAARYLAKEFGWQVEDFRFVWFNEAIQWHNFKSLAYMLMHPDKKRRKTFRRLLLTPEDDLDPDDHIAVTETPALILTRSWIQKVIAEDERGDTYGDMTYNTYRRIRRRFHTEVMGYEYAQKFEGWSYYSKPADAQKHGASVGDEKELFQAYKPLPHTDIYDCDFKAIGFPFDRELGFDITEASNGDEEEEDDE